MSNKPKATTVSPGCSDRFWEKVRKTDGCWFWNASIRKDGYGQFGVAGLVLLAHRVAYSLAVGDLVAGLEVCHTCDCKSCVRPDHLFLGTHKDNMRDMAEKGRAASGENHGGSKLTDFQLCQIRKNHDLTDHQMAKAFNVDRSYISRIRRGVVR